MLGLLFLVACSTKEGTDGEATDEALTAPSKANAIRFLEQSTFGPRPGEPEAVVASGIPKALADQLAVTERSKFIYADTDPPLEAQFFVNAMEGKDQLRQRVAFALSQITVVSQVRFGGLKTGAKIPMGVYLNILSDDALGNYKDHLVKITKNPAMGRYLDMVNNHAFLKDGKTHVAPNENYARELLQLFSVGLYKLNEDGTELLVGGKAQPTYTEEQIEGFAHTLTGWTYGGAACPGAGRGNPANYQVEMIPCANDHNTASQKLLNDEPTTAGAGPVVHLNEAINNIYKHPNVPVFVSKQLIQHLVTSNPSKEYVARVVKVFKSDGQGNRGNLSAVVRAILVDKEARGAKPAPDASATFGHLRNPALFITGVMRRLNGHATAGGQLASWSSQMKQRVTYPPTVFSFYPPDEPLPESGDLLGPEFGIADATSSYVRAGFLNRLMFGATPIAGTTIDWNVVPADPDQAVEWADSTFLHGTMTPDMRSIITAAVKDNRVPVAKKKQMAVYLVAQSAEFQVER